MFNSHTYGVSTNERKSTAGTSLPSGPGTSWVPSTMYSLAPLPLYGGMSKLGRSAALTSKPQPECAGPHTAPCFFAHRSVFRQSVGQCLLESPPGGICSFNRSRHKCPELCEPKPDTSTS